MYKVELDRPKSLLKISYAQHVGAEETQRCAEEIKALLADQPAGFRLLTDLSGLESMRSDINDCGC